MKIRQAVFSVVFLGLLLFVVGCDSRRDQLQQFGLHGQHDLRRIEQTSGFSGQMGGSFFLGIGSISGNLNSERQLQFYWGRTAEEFVSTTLPYSMFRFVVDESKTVPTVEFIFDDDWLDARKIAYTESEKSNLNWWLDESVRAKIRSGRSVSFRVAVVRISRKDLEKEVYLPWQ